MTTVTISGLSSASSVNDTDLTVIDQAGSTLNVTRAILVGSANNTTPATCAAFGYWNTISGTYNLSVGSSNSLYQNTTYGDSNHCVTIGFANTMSGYYSTAIGQLNQVATEGYVIKSVALGYQNTVNNQKSTACGYKNRVASDYGTTVGYYNNISDGPQSTAIGYSNTTSNFGATALGHSNTVSNYLSTSVGFNNTVSGGYAQAFGISNTASAYGSTAAGYVNSATQEGTTAAGYRNQATVHRASAIGAENVANAERSSALGYGNTASGDYSSAIGYQNSTSESAINSSAIGRQNNVSSVYSNAFGYLNDDNSENSPYSNLFGSFNYSNNSFAATAFGLLNNSVGGTLVRSTKSIGGGPSTADTVGVASVAVGILNTAAGDYSIVVGMNNTTTNLTATADNNDNASGTTTFFSNGAPWSGVGPGSGPFTSTISSPQVTDDITLYDFGFNIPDNAVVTGIEIGIEWDGDSGVFADYYAFLIYNNEQVGGNFGTDENTGGVVNYGSPTAIPGGGTFTGNQISSSSFGIAFAPQGSGAGTATVYGAEIEVFYTVNNNSSAIGYGNDVASLNSHAFGGFNFCNQNSASSVSIGLLNNSQGASLNWETGYMTGTASAYSTIGTRSVAIGILNTTSGVYGATAIGYGNTTSGYTAMSIGIFNNTISSYATTMGMYNTANGSSSTACGYQNTASAERSSAFGYENRAGENNSTAFGFQNYASGEFACAIGGENTASGQTASAIGFTNQATQENASAIGYGNAAESNGSSAFGYSNTTTTNSYASAFGCGNNATQSYANAFGANNTASANAASAFGYNNTASATYVTAIGYQNIAEASNTTAVGYTNTVSGTGSSAFGFNNTVSAYGSMAIGISNSVTVGNATAAGYHNTVSSDKGNAFGFINTVSGSHATALGSNAEARIDYTVNTNPIIVRKDNGESSGTEFRDYGGVENIIMSHNVDLTMMADQQIVLPSGCSFYPDEVGLIITDAVGVIGQPTIRFGDESLGEYSGTATLRQSNSQTFDNSSLTPSLNWTEPTLDGSMLILIITFYEADLASPPSGWTFATQGDQPNVQTYIYYALPTDSPHSGTETVVFNDIAFNGSGVIFIAEYTNWGTGAFFDQATAASGFGDTADTGPTLTTTENNELWIASFGSSGGTGFTAPSGGWSPLDVNTFGGGSNYYGIYVLNAVSEGVAEAVSDFDGDGEAQWTSGLATFGAGYQQNFADLVSATATTSLTTTKQRQRFTTLNNYDGHTTLTAGVTVGGAADTLQGRFYWKGILVEDN